MDLKNGTLNQGLKRVEVHRADWAYRTRKPLALEPDPFNCQVQLRTAGFECLGDSHGRTETRAPGRYLTNLLALEEAVLRGKLRLIETIPSTIVSSPREAQVFFKSNFE